MAHDPWPSTLCPRPSFLQRVLSLPSLESRHYLQAWNALRQLGVSPTTEAKELLGVVVEVALDEGLDLLAAYTDRSARYFNYRGAAVVWDHPDASLDEPIDRLLSSATLILDKIGPWGEARPPAPPRGRARINMLAPGGLFFGQGPMGALAADPLAAPTLEAATALMAALIEKTRA